MLQKRADRLDCGGVIVKYLFWLTTALVAGARLAIAQQTEVKLLSQQERAQIERRAENEFFIKGPVVIGSITFKQQAVPDGGFMLMGINVYDVIKRSCFPSR